jgi:23S rRNA (guanine2445-N2)-methyltransferase / 23S rRNA (guanine2069-N7)-methyltransferase
VSLTPETDTQLDIIAACAFGLESVVVHELEDLGFAAKPLSTGRVHFRGDLAAVAAANLWLRSADRVLIRVGSFEASDFDALYERTRALPWEKWIASDAGFPVNGRSVRSQLSSVPACQRCVKKAIVERLRTAHGTQHLPETEAEVIVEVALLDNVASLTIDTSGDGLHKRGYRPMVGEAALKETLAAGLVLLSAWRPNRPLVDPFCGTGTIAIEAAMIGRRIAPGLLRSFDAEFWPSFSRELWAEQRELARSKATGNLGYAIHASDIDPRALDIARRSAAIAGVDRLVHFHQRPFERLSSKVEYGSIITNPPYGVRLGDPEEIERLYRTLPLVLRGLPTWSFHILTARQDLEYLVGQEATRRRKLFNSQIECTYFMFWGPRPPREEPASESADESAGGELADAVAAEGAEPMQPAADGQEVMPAFGGLRARDERELADFRSCLEKNVRHLRKYPAQGVTCFRIYERDQVDVPLIIDNYEGHIHVAEYEREHSRTLAQQADWYDAVRRIISEVVQVSPESVYIKEKHRQRGLTQHEKVAQAGNTLTVQEDGLRFEVNLSDYIDTGLFLDHRLTRSLVRDQAAGARFLNLFCYTGSFSVYAAAGRDGRGAASTTSVDLSNTYLEWTQRNLSLNRLWPGPHRLVRADVLEFLRGHRPGNHYDLAVVDPPTFSNSKRTEEDWEVAVGHREVIALLTPLMSQGGVIYFSTNYRRFKLDEAALSDLGITWKEVSNRTVPPEYRNKRIHRCWRMIVGAAKPRNVPSNYPGVSP